MPRFWLCVSLCMVFSGCQQEAPEGTAPTGKTEVIPVTLAPVQLLHRPDPITGTGVVAGKEETTLSFKIGGILERLTVEEGDRMKEGQLLALLSLTEIDAQVKQAQSAVDKASRDLERLERLHADKVVTLEQMQDARTAQELAAAALEIARFNRDHAQIYAPSDGYVLKRFVERRELVAPGTPIFLTSSSTRQQILKVGITDRDLIQIQRGDSAAVFFDAYPGRSFQASVTQLAERSSPQTGTYEVELALTALRDYPIKIGFIGHAAIFTSIRQDRYLIPLGALVEADRDSVVLFVPDERRQTARRLTIRPQHIGQNAISVLQSDAPPLDFVITRGATYLTDQARIEVKETDLTP